MNLLVFLLTEPREMIQSCGTSWFSTQSFSCHANRPNVKFCQSWGQPLPCLCLPHSLVKIVNGAKESWINNFSQHLYKLFENDTLSNMFAFTPSFWYATHNVNQLKTLLARGTVAFGGQLFNIDVNNFNVDVKSFLSARGVHLFILFLKISKGQVCRRISFYLI